MIDLPTLKSYLFNAINSNDPRCGPKGFLQPLFRLVYFLLIDVSDCKQPLYTDVNRRLIIRVLVLDAGNYIIKAKIAWRENSEIAYPHAFKPLTEVEYSSIVFRSGKQNSLKDYIRINGKPYVIGDSTERHGINTLRTGSNRYTRDYFGIFVAAMIGRFYERGMEISIFGSHPLSDAIYREDFMKPVIGNWYMEVGIHERKFRVCYANTLDVSVKGLMNVILTKEGQHCNIQNKIVVDHW